MGCEGPLPAGVSCTITISVTAASASSGKVWVSANPDTVTPSQVYGPAGKSVTVEITAKVVTGAFLVLDPCVVVPPLP